MADEPRGPVPPATVQTIAQKESPSAPQVADQNTRFLAHLKQIQKKPEGFRALHLHVSALPVTARNRNNISGAITVLNALGRDNSGAIFLLKNLDIVFVAKDVARISLTVAGETIKSSFGLAATGAVAEFYQIYDFANDLPKLMQFAETAAGLQQVTAAAPAVELKAIDLGTLARLEAAIQTTDISTMMFNQPVYSLAGPGKPVAAFLEFYISIQALADAYCPGTDLTSSKWLFNDLTGVLDAAVLRVLAERPLTAKRFSLNLTLATLDSAAFQAFDAALTKAGRASMIIEINKNDVIEHMRLYKRLAPQLTEKGYRLCMDGLDVLIINHIDLNGLGFHFAKLLWSDEAGELDEAALSMLGIRLATQGQVEFILARCDRSESLRFAGRVGIKLAQGRLLDRLVKAQVPV